MNKLIYILVFDLALGGSTRIMVDYAKLLAAKNFRVKFLTIGNSQAMSHLFQDANPLVEKEIIKYDFFFLKKTRAFFYFVRMIRSEKPDFVFSTTRKMNIFAVLAKIFALYKGTVIVREADSLNGLPNLSISSLITKIAISIFYRLADVVIANSEHTAHSLVKLAKLPKKNIKIMHNFISSPIVKVSNKKLSTSKLISFSRLVKKKRVDEIIDAFTLILNKHPGINLEIYGEGDEKTKLEKIAIKANKSSKRIKILGSVEKIEKVVTPGTILIHNSEYEGFGLVMLEAAFSGAYVLAANVGSSEIEVVGRKKSIGELVDTAKKREDRIKILSSHLDQLCREGYRFDVDARIKHLSKFDETSAHNKISEIFS